MPTHSRNGDAKRATLTPQQPQSHPALTENQTAGGPTIELSLSDADKGMPVSSASEVGTSPAPRTPVPPVVHPDPIRHSSATARPESTILFTRRKVLLILCSRNGTARQAITRFGNQMNLALEVIDYNPDQPSSIANQLFDHRDAQFAIIYWSEPNGREPPGFAHPERYVGFALGFALGRFGRGRVFVLGSVKSPPLPGFDRIMLAHLDSTGSWQVQLARRMRSGGLDVDMSKLA